MDNSKIFRILYGKSPYMTKIYKLIDPDTQEIKYIGKTIDPLILRLAGHITEIRRKRSINFKNDWVKSLVLQDKMPIIELIEECEDNIAAEREKYWIYHYKDNCILYNIIFTENEEYYSLMSAMKSKIIYQYDLKGNFIKEWKNARVAAKKLNIHFPNISKSLTNKRKSTGDFQWRFFKADKIEEHFIQVFKKEVHKYDYEGNYIKSFNSAREAEGVKYKLISKCCNGKLNSVYGFRYSFEKTDKLPSLNRKRRRNPNN